MRRSDAIRASFSQKFEQEANDIDEAVQKTLKSLPPKNTSDRQALISFQELLLGHPYLLSYIAQGYPNLISLLVEHVEQSAVITQIAAALLQNGALIDAPISLEKCCYALLHAHVKEKDGLCIILTILMENVGDTKATTSCRSIFESEDIWNLCADAWAEESQFVALCGFIQRCITTFKLSSDTILRAKKLVKAVEEKRSFTETDRPKIDALLILLATIILHAYEGAESLKEIARDLVGPSWRDMMARGTLGEISNIIFDFHVNEESLGNFIPIAEIRETVGKLVQIREWSDSATAETLSRLENLLFPGGAASQEGKILCSFYPEITRALVQAIKCKDMNQSDRMVVQRLLLLVLASSFSKTCSVGETDRVRLPLDVFVAVGGVVIVEEMLEGEDEEVRQGGFFLSSLFLSPACAVNLRFSHFRHVFLSSRCLELMESFIEKLTEREEIENPLSQEMCRVNVRAFMNIIDLLSPSEVKILSKHTVPRIATLISQSLLYPGLMPYCFSALTRMAAEYPFAASMVLDYDFITEQFSIMDTPSECNVSMIIGSLKVMGAMVTSAPVVVTFEWIEVLAKGVELLPLFAAYPDFSTALWKCVLSTLAASEECVEYLFTEIVQTRISEAIRTETSTDLLNTLIGSACFLHPHSPAIDTALESLSDRLNGSADKVITSVTPELVKTVSNYWTVEEVHPTDTEEVDESSPVTPALLLIQLWSSLASSEDSSVEGSVHLHHDLLSTVGQCLSSFGSAAPLDLLKMIGACSQLTNITNRERDNQLRQSFIASAVLAVVFSCSKGEICDKGVCDRVLEVTTHLSANEKFSLPILSNMVKAIESVVNKVASKASTEFSKSLLQSSTISVLMRLFDRAGNCKAEQEKIFSIIEAVVVHSGFSNEELSESKYLLSFIDEFLLQPASSSSAKGLLTFLLNFDGIRDFFCNSNSLQRYKEAIEDINKHSGGMNLAFSVYLQEVEQFGSLNPL